MGIGGQALVTFNDYSKAFDSISHIQLFDIMLELGFPEHIVALLQSLYINQTADMTILSTYLENWRLKLSIAKTMSSVFHLHNREANREINITVNGNRLQFQSAPTYLGVKLDRTLSFRQHLENLSAKTTARVALIRRLAGTTWGAATKTLKVSSLALVYSAAEYCAPVWCRSSHTKKLDTMLNSAMRTVSVCLWATPVNHLTILSGIAPPTLRREAAVLALSRKAQANEDHLLHRMLQERPTRARLKSRRPVSQQAHHLSDLAPPGVTKQSWLRTRWKDDWLAAPPFETAQLHPRSTQRPGPRLASKAVDNPQPPSHGCRPVQLVQAEVGPQGLLCL